MTAAKPRRILVTMPVEMAERVQVHRERGGFRSENAANVDLVRQGLDWFEGTAARVALEEQLRRLRHWRESIP